MLYTETHKIKCNQVKCSRLHPATPSLLPETVYIRSIDWIQQTQTLDGRLRLKGPVQWHYQHLIEKLAKF